MHVVEVMPVTRGPSPHVLSYFSAHPVIPGSVVSIIVRKRAMSGIAVSSTPLGERRSEVRHAGFTLQRLAAPGKPVFAASLLSAVHTIAEHFVTAPGAAFSALAPLPLLRKVGRLPEARAENPGRGFEQLVLQAPLEERLVEYRSLIREAFARRESVLMIVPTIAEALSLEAELSRGVTEYVIVLHSDIRGSQMLARWERAAKDAHPLLLIATPGFLAIPRHDLSLIIVEREGARSYRGFERPFIDARVAAREIARARRIRVLYGDLPLRIETLHAFEQHDAAEMTPIRARLPFSTPAHLIDMREYRKAKKGFRMLGEELAGALSGSAKGQHAFLYVTRRGLNPVVLCDDCGSAVACEACGRDVVLHKTPGGNVFLCHTCGARRSANEKCRACGSWKLSSLGIGSAGVEEAVRGLLPQTPLFRIDRDSAKDHAKAAAIAASFFEAPGAVLVGTERALPYLTAPVDVAGVVSLDSLFALPDYAGEERIFALLARLRTGARHALYIQTREPGRSVFSHALNGTLMDFYRSEIAARERFSYPPFSTLIRVSATGPRGRVEKEIATLEAKLKPWDPALFPGMLRAKGGVSAHLLLKARRWPDPALGAELRSLPPGIIVEVGAGSVLPN